MEFDVRRKSCLTEDYCGAFTINVYSVHFDVDCRIYGHFSVLLPTRRKYELLNLMYISMFSINEMIFFCHVVNHGKYAPLK